MDHHAYLLVGERGDVETHLASILKTARFVVSGNPDYTLVATETFAVDDARNVSRRARERAFGERKVIVIDAARYTPESQNALLKTLEEPSANTHFFIFSREIEHFLPTVISRMRVINAPKSGEKSQFAKEAESYLTSTPAKRIDLAKKFADRHERSDFAPFLDELIALLRTSKAMPDILTRVLTIREFASDPAVMPRLILEHLAFVV